MDSFILELPPVKMELSPNRKNGQHYKTTLDAKREDIKLGFNHALIAANGNKLKSNTYYKLDIVFYHSNKNHADLDNLLSASKHRIDGIAKALGIDDKQFKPITIDRQYRKDAGMTVKINRIDIREV